MSAAVSSVARVVHAQRTAGNRATSSALADGSALGGPLKISRSPADDAEDLRDAIEGWGTDEATIYRVLNRNRGSVPLRSAYRSLTGRGLRTDLYDDMSGGELDRALGMYFGHPTAIWTSALRLRDAIEGAGTDEATVYAELRSMTTAGQRTTIRRAYRDVTGRNLRAAIVDDFSGDELKEALLAYDEGPLTPILRDALELRDAMAGMGTDEAAVYRVLGKHAGLFNQGPINAAYTKVSGRNLEEDIRDDFSGSELTEALRLIGVGEFSNEISQDMFEGPTTVVRGRFTWRFTDGKMKIIVKANFKPDSGVTAPIAVWQSQISGVWNNYALKEPGGLSIPIQMSLVNDAGGKPIRVKENKVPGTWTRDDRANAGMWFPKMKPTTAPHEYGHLIGLQDEYQRTHDDFEEITGAAPTGPANASGKTNEAIATELNTAFSDPDEAKQPGLATTVLAGVGLIVGGLPQQGDFAQAVMTAYDAAYSTSLQEELIDLPEKTNWTLLSVFSYASGTAMGNPGVVPHEHPVAPRHLREFADIATTAFPTFTWTTGPR